MITCILIDDEPKAVSTLSYELAGFSPRISILREFTSAAEAVAFLESAHADVVFLDVEMPGMNGFRFLEKFPKRNFEVVLTTAYDRYALKAYRSDVVDYLVKPIDPEDLLHTIVKLERIMGKKSRAAGHTDRPDEISKKIRLSIDRKIVFLDPEEIIYCESDGNYCRIFLEGQRSLFITRKLKYMEEILPDRVFYRVHNSYIVNLFKIKEFHRDENRFLLTNDAVIPVSRHKRNDIMDVL